MEPGDPGPGGGGPEAEEALEDLYRIYWFPLYSFVRRSGHPPADAQDLTQGFFSEIFLNGLLERVNSEKGSLRSYLLGAIKNFVAQQHRKETAIKRGGGLRFVPIDDGNAEIRYRNDPVDHLSPDHLFDRRWAMELLERSMDRLGHGLSPEQTTVFREIAPYLTESRGGVPYSDLAGRLGMEEGAVRVALHRLRARHREILIQVVAETVESPDLVEAEIRHLIASFD